MKTISLINLKGGVGKTTTALAMAYLLAEKRGKKVLLIDNDKQGNASRILDRYDNREPGGTVNMLRYRRAEPYIQGTRYQNMDLLSCNLYMELAEKAVLLDQEQIQGDRYRKALEPVDRNYEYCIIDNPPDIGMNVINALAVTNEIIIPVQLENWSLDGLEELVKQIKEITRLNPKARIAGILATDYEKSKTSEAALEWLRKRSGQKVFQTVIRHSKAAKDSTIYHKPLPEYSTRCGASRDYKKFMAEYTGRE